MATTEQRTGFRLPWATEPRSDAAPEADADYSDPTVAIRAALLATEGHGAEQLATHKTAGAKATTDPANEAITAEATVTQDTATPTIDPRLAALSGMDDAPTLDSNGAAPAEPAAPAAPKARRDNPLVAGLVRAMREAAQTARDEALAKLAEEAKARIETIHAESAEAATLIRKQSEEDVAGIRDWSKAEMARIREETEERIAGRRRRLELEVDDHAALVAHRIERVQAAATTFEGEMDRFFKALLAEEDAARLAGFAVQLPEPPSLEDVAVNDGWTPSRTLDSGDAAAAEAAALADLDDDELSEPAAAATVDPETADAEEIAKAAFVDLPPGYDPDIDSDGADDADTDTDSGDSDVVQRLATFTGPAVGDEDSTSSRITVVGLVSVASIAGFKRAIGRLPGVTGVAVSSGPSGDFVFTIQHAASVDLRALIPALDGFTATVTGDADGVLSVSATEPDAKS